MNNKKIVLPHEHGGWAMVSVPFLFGVLAGTPRWSHILLFIALSVDRQTAIVLFRDSIHHTMSLNIWHVQRKSERAILNDFCAILIFSLGGAASYLYGDGGWNFEMLTIVLYNLMYFMGTAFFVKTVFREKKNPIWKRVSQIYHVVILIVPVLLGQPWMILPFLFPLVRTFLFSGKTMLVWWYVAPSGR